MWVGHTLPPSNNTSKVIHRAGVINTLNPWVCCHTDMKQVSYHRGQDMVRLLKVMCAVYTCTETASDVLGCCRDPCLTVGGFHTRAPADITGFRLGCNLLTITNWLYELGCDLLTTTNRPYVRMLGVWRYTQLTRRDTILGSQERDETRF